ncbi:DUF1572 family protein [Granulicella sp. dw_53]|uniref:DUF1572 family protein n=1 Tax=Granulicella sp. dw_53 TaxID=2719792 RepID=UPI001BD25E58|nr:DUF1572 family protein [Granulicella sp. dw_53]
MTNEVAELFLDYSNHKLAALTQKMDVCLVRLSEEQIWARGGAHENAVGNLVLHLCGNTRQWILHGIGGREDVRLRDTEFETTGGMRREELLEMFGGTISEAREVISRLTGERLGEMIRPQGQEVTVLAAIYQVVAHVGEHVGQIVLLTKQMVGTDLDLTMPRRR